MKSSLTIKWQALPFLIIQKLKSHKVITESKVSNLTKMQFGLSDSELYQAEALSNAIQNSRAVARLIAESYDVELGTIHTVRHRTTQNIGANRAMLMQTEMNSRASPEPTYQQKNLEVSRHVLIPSSVLLG